METVTITQYAKSVGVKRELVDSRLYNGRFGRKAGIEPAKYGETVQSGNLWFRTDLDRMMSNYDTPTIKVTKKPAPVINQNEFESAMTSLRESNVDIKSYLYIMETLLQKK
jgi:hypothetical protein